MEAHDERGGEETNRRRAKSEVGEGEAG